MVNILVTGGNGQLGLVLKEIASDYSTYSFIFTDISNLDITDHNLVREFIHANKICVIINCAAYTAVDKAESEHELADAINHLAVANLAQIAKENRIKLIHISTDYVFDGTKNTPYLETDTPNPQTIYGQTKLDGELALHRINPVNSSIIRTSWLYSKHGNNFVNKIISKLNNKKKIFVVKDEISSPTNAYDLSLAIMEIIPKLSNSNTEVYHYSNLGFCSRYEFANKIKEYIKVDCKIISINQDSSKIKRPKFSALDSSKIFKNFKLVKKSWEDSLKTHF